MDSAKFDPKAFFMLHGRSGVEVLRPPILALSLMLSLSGLLYFTTCFYCCF